MLKFKEEKQEEKKEGRYKGKSVIFLGRLKKKLEAVIADRGATDNEKKQATNKLKEVDEALEKAKEEMKEKRKKK